MVYRLDIIAQICKIFLCLVIHTAVFESRNSITEAAKKLGLNYNLLCRWKKELTEVNSVEVDAFKLELKKLWNGQVKMDIFLSGHSCFVD